MERMKGNSDTTVQVFAKLGIYDHLWGVGSYVSYKISLSWAGNQSRARSHNHRVCGMIRGNC